MMILSEHDVKVARQPSPPPVPFHRRHKARLVSAFQHDIYATYLENDIILLHIHAS